MWKAPHSFCVMRVAPHIDIKCSSTKLLDASSRSFNLRVVNVNGGEVICR